MRREPLLDAQGFAEIIPVSRETLARLEAYTELLIRWSARINLIGRDTIADLWRRHILDSGQLKLTRSRVDLASVAWEVVREATGAGLARPVTVRIERGTEIQAAWSITPQAAVLTATSPRFTPGA